MSISDGQKVDEANSNPAWMSRTTDTNTTGKVDLENVDAASGASVFNVQREHNGSASFSGRTPNGPEDEKPSWLDSSVGDAGDDVKDRADALTTQVTLNESNIVSNDTDIADLTTLSGRPANSTDQGTFAGSTITDNVTTHAALQELETQLETISVPLDFQGLWNADTNTPTLVSSVGVEGDFYIVSVTGTTNLDGISDWVAGDWAVFASGVWNKVDNSDSVASVNGATGVVVLDSDDIAEGSVNLYATGSIDTHSDVDVTTSAPSVNDILEFDGSNWVPVAAGASAATDSDQNILAVQVFS